MFGAPQRDAAAIEQLDGGLKNLLFSFHNNEMELGAVALNSGWFNFQNAIARK
jgi:hypothetical protein